MDHIQIPDSVFAFDCLTVSPPVLISGGHYFLKFSYNGHPLYIQPPKCTTKHGICHSGKKHFSDLVFSNLHEDFIQWVEKLENQAQRQLYDNRKKWFETELDMNDIESSFVSTLKLFKSGKCYALRTSLPCRLGKCILKLFDDAENDMPYDSIDDSTNIVTILEVQGIRCTARSFQIDIEMKQMMAFQPNTLFEKCIISIPESTATKVAKDPFSIPNMEVGECLDQSGSNDALISIPPVIAASDDIVPLDLEPATPVVVPEEGSGVLMDERSVVSTPVDDMIEVENVKDNVLKSIEIDTMKTIYNNKYNELRKRAKIAEDESLKAYLDAKNLKKVYNLQVRDSDDEPMDSGNEEGD